ncbi:MAG: hypothetical protein JO346_13710 [Alphaproteobacteria bacterium]|nr:hypothetical protein [Alphaproteobacteria bacterium]
MSISPISSVAITPAVTSSATATQSDDNGDESFSFDDLIDVVNPLQHLPIVGTLYRAITGDTINTVPKIAGDTLYGGLMGFASSVADFAFEKITGHNFGDTVLALAEDAYHAVVDGAETETTPSIAIASAAPPVVDTTAAPVPSNAPALPAPPAAVNAASLQSIVVPGQDALLNALTSHGVNQDIATRAADAYRRSMGVADSAAAAALRGPVN